MQSQPQLDHPLMENNITSEDINAVVSFLQTMPRLTQGSQVQAFEEEWSEWLGVNHTVFVNSGSSANLLTMAGIRHLYGPGEVIVPPLTWVSDIASVLHNGLTPVFVDIDPRNLGMDSRQVIKKLSKHTRAVFITYVQGFNCLNNEFIEELQKRGIPLIEDVCESHGATFNGRKLGSYGLASNFSFYFAHHMSTIEGGVVCTNDNHFYQTIRVLRSHGMVRESSSEELKQEFIKTNPILNIDFIFAYPAYNCRNTEIGGVLGRSQLKKLDTNNRRRSENWNLFLSLLDPQKYRTDFDSVGSSNYAFALVLKEPDFAFRDRIEAAMRSTNIEFRRGSSGGGNQLRQPYLKGIVPEDFHKQFPEVEHIHHFGYYIGNYPTLSKERIRSLCSFLNSVS